MLRAYKFRKFGEKIAVYCRYMNYRNFGEKSTFLELGISRSRKSQFRCVLVLSRCLPNLVLIRETFSTVKDFFLFSSVSANGQSQRVYYIYCRETTSNGVGDKNSSTDIVLHSASAYLTTHRYKICWDGQLADWTIRRLVNSQMPPLNSICFLL